MYKTINELEASSLGEIIEIVDKQPRLQEFVRCLYTRAPYNLGDLKSFDANNFVISQLIVKTVYPEGRTLFSKYF